MKKIIIVTNDIWDNSDEMWGFNIFAENGFHIEIWRVGALIIGTKIWEKPKTQYKIYTIKNNRELRQMILKRIWMKPIYLFYIAGSQYLNRARAFIKLTGGCYCNVSIGPLGSRSNHIQLEETLKVEHHWMDRFLPKYNFLGSDIHKCSLHSKYEIEHANNIMIHIYDYDCYLRTELMPDEKDIENNYILFYDQNFLEHKDITNYGIKKWIPNERVYIEEIKKFLRKVEMEFSLPIVIAAHPTGKKSDLRKIYGDRKIVYDKTCLYTKNAKFVIACMSGAINFAVLYNKPILFWNCYQLKNSYLYYDWQCIKCRILNGRILDISKSLDQADLKTYLTNPKNYKDFMEYITSNRKEKRLFFEIVVEYLNKIKMD